MNSVTSFKRVSLLPLLGVFAVSFVLLFLSMSRTPSMYDEGLILTGAMRVAAGQIPHRDFYANYGPAQFYFLAGLFKLFGRTLLTERIFDLFLRSTLLVTVFAIASIFCRRVLALGVYFVALFWVFSAGVPYGSPLQANNVLNLAVAFLVLPVLTGSASSKRLLFAGALTGVSSLFRYDTGIALFGICTIIFMVSAYGGEGSLVERAMSFAKTIGPYLLGGMMIVVSALFYYLSRAPLHSFFFDIFEYPGKNYYRERNLPFPTLHVRHLGDLGVYIPIFIAFLALAVSLSASTSSTANRFAGMIAGLKRDAWRAFLFVFGLLTLIMYLKGYVRVAPAQMYLGIIPSLLVIAVFVQFRSELSQPLRLCGMALLLLSILGSFGALLTEAKSMVVAHSTMVPLTLRTPLERTWCMTPGELTKGVCFLPGTDRIQVIEFLENHTTPTQTLLVANTRNDIAFANDNLLYFASGRMPATHWSHFDPGLQNTAPIQLDMLRELDVSKPPYIVIDAEFENVHEPNESSRSTGVTLLDTYIQGKYATVANFGMFSIRQRIGAAESPLDSGGKR